MITAMSQRTILIVDDNVNLALGFAKALAKAGYTAHAAHTAEEGLRLARVEHPDGIILDIGMPFINGLGFLYRLRALPAHGHTPVMVVTGASLTEETRTELGELRAVIKFKPLGLEQLLAETRMLLSSDSDAGQSLSDTPSRTT
jgi:two-component system, OmpR family, KDP operon response regulator KdpE